MTTHPMRVLILFLLALSAYLAWENGLLFVAFILVILAVIYLVARMTPRPVRPASPALAGGAAQPPAPPDYGKTQEHISRHTRGFGEALDNIGHFIVWVLGGMHDRRKNDGSMTIRQENRRHQ